MGGGKNGAKSELKAAVGKKEERNKARRKAKDAVSSRLLLGLFCASTPFLRQGKSGRCLSDSPSSGLSASLFLSELEGRAKKVGKRTRNISRGSLLVQTGFLILRFFTILISFAQSLEKEEEAQRAKKKVGSLDGKN